MSEKKQQQMDDFSEELNEEELEKVSGGALIKIQPVYPKETASSANPGVITHPGRIR